MDWEKDLPPIARERLARIGELTRAEKEQVIDSERVDSILSEFHQGRMGAEDLWKRLREEDRPSLLREAQVKLVDSLSFGSGGVEMQRRREAVLAIESLKEQQNTSMVEHRLTLMEDLQRAYRAEVEQAYNRIRAEVERKPQLRVKQVQQGADTALVELTTDEAIRQFPQWQDFLSQQEGRYRQEFARAADMLKRELR